MDLKTLPKIVVLNFGSQTAQLIATRLRNQGFYAQILPFNTSAKALQKLNPRGIIFSGGPTSLSEKNSPRPDPKIYTLGIPLLGICYGLQLITEHFGGQVVKGATRKEYGAAPLSLKKTSPLNPLFKNIKNQKSICWMSHGDEIEKMPQSFKAIGCTLKSPYAIIARVEQQIYALQFHPEVTHTAIGPALLKNFAQNICRMPKNWEPKDIIREMIQQVRKTVGKRKVLHAISGGVDSTVMAAILHKALGKKLKCVMVETGLLRKDEAKNVQRRFQKFLKTKVEIIDARQKFLKPLEKTTDGQKRRKFIGKIYVDIFKTRLGKTDFLSQGTLYPDVIESAADVNAPAHTIKTHHNRAPEIIRLIQQGRVIEIFKDLFKDEVRAIGRSLKLPPEIVQRQPFPGPGLAIRILGKITPQKLEILREADSIVIEELKKARLYYKISQTIVALDSHQVTCVKGDAKEKGYLILIRNVETRDFMTASPYELPVELRRHISTRILNEVPGTGRVLFDESSKPPATICYL